MPDDSVYRNTVGLAVILDCGQDITGATGATIKCKRPSGAVVSWSATIITQDSLTHYLQHITVAGDLPVAGDYLLQASLTLDGWTGLGATATLTVLEAFN